MQRLATVSAGARLPDAQSAQGLQVLDGSLHAFSSDVQVAASLDPAYVRRLVGPGPELARTWTSHYGLPSAPVASRLAVDAGMENPLAPVMFAPNQFGGFEVLDVPHDRGRRGLLHLGEAFQELSGLGADSMVDSFAAWKAQGLLGVAASAHTPPHGVR